MTGPERLEAWVRARPWVADGLLAVGVAAVLAPQSVDLAAGAGAWAPVLVGALGVGHLLVAARRVRPRLAFAATCAVMLVLVAAPDLPLDDAQALAGSAVPPLLLPSALVFPVQLHAVAARTTGRWPGVALLTGLAGAVLATVRLSVPGTWVGADTASPGTWWFLLLGALVAVVLAAWGLGRFGAVRTTALEAERASAAARAVVAERQRIAREMHDVVAHSLAVMVRQAEGGRRVIDGSPARAADALEVVAQVGREALGDMRSVIGALRAPDATDGADGARTPAPTPGVLEGSPQPTVGDVPGLVDGVVSAGLPVSLETVGEPVALERAASLAAYRVVQESLTNVARHAPDGRASVRLTWLRDGLRVEVTDDGGGRPATPSSRGGQAVGHGLLGLRERVGLVGGTLTAGPADRGFAVVATIPTARARWSDPGEHRDARGPDRSGEGGGTA